MNKARIDLSIIIVNWNARKYLRHCLKSIYRRTKKISLEIWVVDNNSWDGTQEMVKKEFKKVTLIANSKNLGFAKANNQAIKKARGRYILILNPDILVSQGVLEKTLNFLKKHPRVGMAGVRLTDEEGNPQFSAGRRLPSIWGEICVSMLRSPFPKSKIFGSYHMSFWDHQDRCQVEAILGAFMMIPKRLLKKVKGFDESFFIYGEDVDLCLRVRKAGYKIFYLGDIKMIHFGAKSTSYSSDSILRSGMAGVEAMYHYFYKNKSPLYAQVYKFIVRFFSFGEFLARMFLQIFPRNRTKLKKTKIKMCKKILFWDLNET